MIGFLRGTLVDEASETVVLEVNGVGYELFCSSNTLDDFFAQKEVRAWVHTHVREDAFVLFGFSTQTEKQIFESLLKVNGVGPKLAIKILSGATIDAITTMIENADSKGLTQLPKVGKKTAEQIILTLKGKLAPVEGQKAAPLLSPVRQQIHSALLNLGFKPVDVDQVVETLRTDIDFESGVREGLSLLSGGR